MCVFMISIYCFAPRNDVLLFGLRHYGELRDTKQNIPKTGHFYCNYIPPNF